MARWLGWQSGWRRVPDHQVGDIEAANSSKLSVNAPPPAPPSLSRSASSQLLEAAADTATTSVRFVRQVSQSLQPKPTVYCGICLGNVDAAEVFGFSGHGGCAHQFCRDCLAGYLAVEIREGNTEAPCPYFCVGDGCGATAAPSDVEFLISDPELLHKYARFKKMKEKADYRECPSCGDMILPNKNFFGRIRSEMACQKCGTEFCFYHSNQHPNEKCIDFITRTCKEEAVSTTLIQSTCKNCPSCGFPTEKNRGCNHMTCVKCSCDWCWLCNRDISKKTTGQAVEFHYSPHNIIRGCPLSQFTQGNGEFLWLDKISSLVWLVAFTCLFLVALGGWVMLVLALSLATCCCCGCCGGELLRQRGDNFLELAAFCCLGPPAGLALLAVTLLWVVLSVAWSLALTPLVALASPVWLTLIACGKCTFMDVVKFWGFCGLYLYQSMAVQFVVTAIRGERM